MIELRCACGLERAVPESQAGTYSTCEKCGAATGTISAEHIPDGAGVGDFDTQFIIARSPQVAGALPVGTQVLLGGVSEIEVGKLDSRHLILPGLMVSRLHCKLRRIDFGPSRWMLVDNASTNGVFVNDHRVTEHELKPGDLVRIGDHELKFGFLPAPAPPPVVHPGGKVCPSCSRSVPAKVKICVACGIDIKTGRSIVVSKGLDEDDLAIRADTWIRILSWFIPFGLFPIASEAFGTRKPYTTWTIAGVTLFTSLMFFAATRGDDPSPALLNLMHWTGSREAMIHELSRDVSPDELSIVPTEVASPRSRSRQMEAELGELREAMRMAIPEEIGLHWYQLLTCAFLHDSSSIVGLFLHVGGNFLFLLVFGLRVNELIGNVKMTILYPLLAVGSSLVNHIASLHSSFGPTVGASGAIMGLAGVYFVFFPVQRVHMAIWFRGGLLTKWQCFYKLFTMRGFWLLVLWIGVNDVLPTALGSRDHVAHWAHLGGFLVGMGIALILLLSRNVNAHGGDILSVTLGRRAWALVGRPTDRLMGQPVAA